MLKNSIPRLKSLGQNFLTDKNIQNKIIKSANLTTKDTVIEIGPGDGFLTDALLESAKHVFAVEIDKKLCVLLQDKYKDNKKINLIKGDILKTDFKQFKDANKLIANIPYNITSQIIFKLIYENINLDLVLLMMQKEVADRIVATHNTKAYGILSIICQLTWDIEKCFNVSKNVFNPKPKVDSSVVKFTPKKTRLIKDKELKDFMNFIKSCFSTRRKILLSVVSKNYNIPKIKLEKIWQSKNIPKTARPENLSPETWYFLYKTL